MKNRCIDAGREGCPCTLAESGDCLICSRLAGGNCNDCSWQGTCIYTLYQQNGWKTTEPRESRGMDMVEVRDYNANFVVITLSADKGFCQKAAVAGAYVFVRSKEDREWFGAPVSVLKAEPDKERIHLGICACGPKTTRIFQAVQRFQEGLPQQLGIRGIYYNGLKGLNALREAPGETFIFAKGIAIAPLRNLLDGGKRYTKYLQNMKVYIDTDKIGMDFIKEYFGDLAAASVEIRDFARQGLCSLEDLDLLEESRGNVFALTSPHYAHQIQRAADAAQTIVMPVEGNVCCGEGICGACTYNDAHGKTVRRCKDAG